MGRTYQAEPSIQEQFDALVSNKADVQIGLLIGKQGVGARDLVLGHIPTPASEDGNPAASATASQTAPKGKKGPATAATGAAAASSVTVDVDWVSEHAAQIARMLPGGIRILGAYLFTSDAGYQSALPQLHRVMQAIADLTHATTGLECLLLHADASSRKINARSWAMASNTPQLSVADLKWAPCLANLMSVTCRWKVDLGLPACSNTAGLQAQLDSLKETTAASIQSSIGSLQDGNIPAADTLLVDMPAAAEQKQSTGPILSPSTSMQIQLLPLLGSRGDAIDDDKSQQHVVGFGSLQGEVCGVAVVHKRQPWSQVLQELKADLCASLSTRIELLIEDALSWEDEQSTSQAVSSSDQQQNSSQAATKKHPLMSGAAGLSKAHAAALPHRATVSVLGGLPFSDYLMPGEGVDDCAARILQLLGESVIEAELSEKIVQLEAQGQAPKRLGQWQPHAPAQANQEQEGRSKPSVKGTIPASPAVASSTRCSSSLMGGAAVALTFVVALLAYMLARLQA